MKGHFKKLPGRLVPADEQTANHLFNIKNKSILAVDFTQPRNYKFLQKYMTLINHGFETWEPPENSYKGMDVEKNPERFRKDVQILAGYGYPVVNIKGETRMESRSISFGKMSEDDFTKLYSSVINVLLKRVFKNYTRDDIDNAINELMEYAK